MEVCWFSQNLRRLALVSWGLKPTRFIPSGLRVAADPLGGWGAGQVSKRSAMFGDTILGLPDRECVSCAIFTEWFTLVVKMLKSRTWWKASESLHAPVSGHHKTDWTTLCIFTHRGLHPLKEQTVSIHPCIFIHPSGFTHSDLTLHELKRERHDPHLPQPSNKISPIYLATSYKGSSIFSLCIWSCMLKAWQHRAGMRECM